MTVSLTDGPYKYNRFDGYAQFDSLTEAYQKIYEESSCDDKDDDEKEDSVSSKEKKAIKDEVKKHKKKEHGEDDEKEGDKKELPDFLKKEDKELVIGYLMNEGLVNNEVSGEVIYNHMSDEWKNSIVEGKIGTHEPIKSGRPTPFQKAENNYVNKPPTDPNKAKQGLKIQKMVRGS